MQTSITLHGHIVGPIWMPAAECWKEVSVSAADFERSTGEAPTARDLALRATQDGDFQHCKLTADSYFLLTRTRRDGNHTMTVERVYTVDKFPSIADCVDPRELWELDEGEGD